MSNNNDTERMSIKEFISPNSSLTPGLAGAITTSVASPLVFYFGLNFPWVALAVSLMLSLLVVTELKNVSNIKRCVYCFLNTLIIFSVAAGVIFNINPPKPPPPGPPKEMVNLACEILDTIEMPPKYRELIKLLVSWDVQKPKNDSRVNLLEPYSAWAQSHRERRPEPPTARNSGSSLGSPENVRKPVPRVTQQEVNQLRKLRDQQQEIKLEQKRTIEQWYWRK